MSLAWKLGLVALVALALTALPGTARAFDLVLTALTLAFLAAIALLGERLYRRFRLDLESLPDSHRALLYGSLGLILLTLCATGRLFGIGGAGIVAWLALLAAAGYACYRVYARYRAYG